MVFGGLAKEFGGFGRTGGNAETAANALLPVDLTDVADFFNRINLTSLFSAQGATFAQIRIDLGIIMRINQLGRRNKGFFKEI